MLYQTALSIIAVVSLLTPVNGNQKDFKALDGTWIPQSSELAGNKLPDEILKTIKLELEDGKYTVTAGKDVDKGTIRLDESRKPKEMDIVGTAGPNKGKTIPAIYEVEGDTLKICYDLAGKERPKSFKTESGSMALLMVYKRMK